MTEGGERDVPNHLTAIVLAAGRGTRLRRLTTLPKVLLSLGKSTVLERHLQTLDRCRIRHIVLVLGYRGELVIRELPCHVTTVHNHEYSVKGNSHSLYLGLLAASYGGTP